MKSGTPDIEEDATMSRKMKAVEVGMEWKGCPSCGGQPGISYLGDWYWKAECDNGMRCPSVYFEVSANDLVTLNERWNRRHEEQKEVVDDASLRRFRVSCDECGEYLPESKPTMDEAARYAANNGWIVVYYGKGQSSPYVNCPECIKETTSKRKKT